VSAAEPRWVGRLVVEFVQHDLIVTHGGLLGLRDENALESALASPRQAWNYSEQTDLAALAAAYAFGIARAHPFNDGNKRVAFVTAAVFVELNGIQIVAPEAQVVEKMLRLADGELDEGALADWLRGTLHRTGGNNSR
jgi:death-on-curing protein